MSLTKVVIQQQDFDIGMEHKWLTKGNVSDGAVVTFVGLVRDMNQGNQVTGLSLEHYPAMTEKALKKIVNQARQKWPLGRVSILHRVGDLNLNDNIVFVGTTSKHRHASFLACEFIMDFLKTEVPIWKKERSTNGEYWVESKESDQRTNDKWQSQLKK